MKTLMDIIEYHNERNISNATTEAIQNTIDFIHAQIKRLEKELQLENTQEASFECGKYIGYLEGQIEAYKLLLGE